MSKIEGDMAEPQEQFSVYGAEYRRQRLQELKATYLQKLQEGRDQQDLAEQLAREKLEDEERIARLEEEVGIDPLTGLFTKERFTKETSAELDRILREDNDISIIMADADNFKDINDRYGHLVGDRILKEIAAVLKGVRMFDKVGRFGGEEMVLALPDTPPDRASSVIERMRNQISRLRFQDNGQEFGITVSFGISALKTKPRNLPDKPTPQNITGVLDNLLSEADQALYAAKGAGRNRTGLTTESGVQIIDPNGPSI